MAFLEIKTSTVWSIFIRVIGFLLGGFLLLFGIGNLIFPDVADEYLLQNALICLATCVIGSIFALLAVAVFTWDVEPKEKCK